MTGHIEWFLAVFKEAGGLKQSICEAVSENLFEVGVSGSCLALACVCACFPYLELLLIVGAGFEGTRMTTEELDACADSFMCVVRSCLGTIRFDPLRGIFGS